MEEEKPKIGAPTKFKPEYVEQANKLCLLGAIDDDIADFFDVCQRTINYWKQKHPEFKEALEKGKMIADTVVAEKLFQRATGYSHPEDKMFVSDGKIISEETTKHYPPDTAAAIFWLKNRQSKLWRDKQELVNTNYNSEPIPKEELDEFNEILNGAV